MTMPPLPKPDLEDHEHEAWGQNVRSDFVTVEKMRKYGDDRAAAERDNAIEIVRFELDNSGQAKAIIAAIMEDTTDSKYRGKT